MPISVKITKENKDGSADALIHFDKEGLETLVRHGLISMLTEAIDEYKVEPDETVPRLLPEEQDEIIRKARKLVAEDEQ